MNPGGIKNMQNVLKEQINFTEPNSVKNAIQSLASNIYGGTNVAGERVAVMLQQNVGMTIHVYQSNDWIRVDEYDADGFKESETFNGRWHKKKFLIGDLVKTQHGSASRYLIIVDYNEEKQRYVAKLATNNGLLDKRSIHRELYLKEDNLMKVS